MLPLAPGFTKEDGLRYYPSAVLVTNFKKTESDTPSLLYRSEVQTLLHEAGHGMHHLTSMTNFSRLHGPAGCPIDFVEAPSQMMENFAYSPPVLKMLSKHWSYLSPEFDTAWKKSHKEKPPEKLPDTVIDNILRNKDAYNAYTNLYQVFYASWDMKIHEAKTPKAAKDIDTTAEWNRIYTDYVKGIDTPSPKWGHLQSTFNYPMVSTGLGILQTPETDVIHLGRIRRRILCVPLVQVLRRGCLLHCFQEEPHQRRNGNPMEAHSASARGSEGL